MNQNENELYHYGVLGQKWGVRRYQNVNGTLTKEGAKRLKKEIKADNRKAFENGRDASIAARALHYQTKRAIRSEKRAEKALEKDPTMSKKSTRRKINNELADKDATMTLAKHYKAMEQKSKDHCDSLIKKYGSENIKSIKYSDYTNEKTGTHKMINERVNTGAEWVASAAGTAASFGVSTAMGLPVFMIYTPTSAEQRGRSMANTAKYMSAQKYK